MMETVECQRKTKAQVRGRPDHVAAGQGLPGERAHNPSVVGSSPTRPTDGDPTDGDAAPFGAPRDQVREPLQVIPEGAGPVKAAWDSGFGGLRVAAGTS